MAGEAPQVNMLPPTAGVIRCLSDGAFADTGGTHGV